MLSLQQTDKPVTQVPSPASVGGTGIADEAPFPRYYLRCYAIGGYSIPRKRMKLTFVEVPAFIRQIDKLGKPRSVEILTAIQNELLIDPKRGDIIRGTGGARKGRIGNPSKGKGKRGGFRYIYAFFELNDRIYLFYFYEKKAQDDLTDEQTKLLAEVIKRTKNSLKSGE